MSEGQYVTPTKAARGLGSAKSGTQHHIRLRVTAIALAFLVPWCLYAVIKASGAGYEGALAWVGQPINATLLILTAAAVSYHMRLGMQVIIEDYIAKTATRTTLLILNTFAAYAMFIAVAMAVVQIWTAR
ncbi:succinate dehydrogenase, hydrophobic membrane anchor protein [Hyphomonas neptunium ATCC 15444]|uniref:Succinate dehydrogenase hydrophobic membrane anchor subunit n=2 Tax=Hyphomonas TaxID=85 RepID=Q0BX76_HYPNA|nr:MULTISPECIES: succinate dehydrogenase, hydrophobic membrane anchor protein [Hyphomonas]ABI77817.1 succinate dehydrogenase, hydrophobic membrane anchor protein [Hyphomonas neptunium ATCC 15444]KCZ86888.1 succinate dehydrogenase, hydrophobic membrane anchor protein [Hyphomonas hirschiana VP5]